MLRAQLYCNGTVNASVRFLTSEFHFRHSVWGGEAHLDRDPRGL